MVSANWYPSGGDWTYINTVNNIYESMGHKIVPYAMKNSKNFETSFDKWFIDHIDYKKLNSNKLILTEFFEFFNFDFHHTGYSKEAEALGVI